MSESEQKSIDLNDFGDTAERVDSVGIKQIEGKEINITGFRHTRGKQSKFTRPDQIGADGLTDYYTITTKESFDLQYKDEGVKPINGFFVTEAISKQINRVPDIQDQFKNGVVVGPCKPIKRTSEKTGNPYWCLVFPSEEGY